MENKPKTKGELKPRKRGFMQSIFRRYLTAIHHPVYYRHFYSPGREKMPADGNPVVLVSNHQNCLIDPLALVFLLGDRKPRFLARASVFQHPMFDKIIRALGALPTYRAKVDGVKGVAKNKGTLEEVAVSLSHGETVVLYPEGQHQNKRWLGAFSPAYLKMAFGAAEETGFTREVYVIPTANHYSHYRLPREDMMIVFGDPIALSPYYEEYKESPREVIARLNTEIRSKVEGLMLNVEDLENYKEIDFLRTSSFGFEFAEKNSFEAKKLPEKLEADKLLVAKLKTATEKRPEEMEEVYKQTRRLRKGIEKMGIREWLLTKKRSPLVLVLFALGMIALFPLFVASIAPTWLVFLAPLIVNNLAIKDRQFRGSINLALTLLVTYPLCGIIPTIVLLCLGLWEIALGYLVAFPLMIIFSSLYMRWSKKLLGYARLIFGDKRSVMVLYGSRAKLHAKLNEILSLEE